MSFVFKDENTLESILRSAGAKLLEFRTKIKRDDWNIEAKADGTSVTAADYASNEILIGKLSANWPDFGILSEEMPRDDKLAKMEKVWIIDPLDGTKSFINGRDDFSVLAGLSVNSKIHFGMMFFPVLDVLAKAGRGLGAFVNNQPIKVSEFSKLRAGSLYYRNFQPQQAEYLYRETMDSGLAFLALASGEIDGIIMRMTTHKEWDIAAPSILVEESGGMITDEQGRELRFNQGDIYYKYVIASNRSTHDQLLEIVKNDMKNNP